MTDILNLIAQHQIDVEWRPKALFIRKHKDGVDLANEPICIKLNKYSSKLEALEAGLKMVVGE